ncbi:MAG: chorismate mutase [SAR324 cluster bacterium]|nr:chorismate mutase [SAR324 cluster bacterium]
MASNLDEYRRKINQMDMELLQLLNQRAECAIEIGKIKRAKNMEIFVPGREKEILENLSQHNAGPLSNEMICHIFQEIISIMKEVQSI